MADDLKRAEMGGIEYVVTHPGSGADSEAIHRVRELCLEALDGTKGVQLLIENVAGGGDKVGGSFEELAEMVDGTEMGVCLDTCHALAAGYPIHESPGEVLDNFEETVGLDRLKVLHLNDSVGALGSHVDRHDHIGRGEIGMEGFRRILSDPRIRRLPGILETPQRATDDPSDDIRNISTIRQILGSVGAP